MSRSLAVWMGGERVALLEGPAATARTRDRLRLTYSASATLGAPLLSVSLPVRRDPIRAGAVHAYFNGLLPEGRVREALAYDFDVASDDALGLLAALGRDCAGALVVIPPEQEPPGPGEWLPIDEDGVRQRLANLHVEPLGVDGRVRVSLAGMQAKLLLARSSDGAWCLPVDGAPSTHILKPPIPLVEGSVKTEGFCLQVARALGIAAASAEVLTIGGAQVLAVARYDRTGADDATVRIHQEDFCQALGLEPGRKYQRSRSGSPSLADMAEVLVRWARSEERWRLLDLLTLNVGLGNADAHVKNYSLLHPPGTPIRLAPAYDVMCTLHDRRVQTTMGLWVNGVADLTAVTADDLVAEAVGWGLPRDAVAERVHALLDRLPAAMAEAADRIPPPRSVLDALAEHRRRLLTPRPT